MNKSIQFLSFLFTIILWPALIQAQITLNSNGDVSMLGNTAINGTLKIGNPSTNAKMSLKCSSSCLYAAYIYNQGGSGVRYGLDSRVLASGTNYGIRGYAEFGSTNRGVVGEAIDGSVNYGVQGNALGPNSYGGYFTGGLYVSGGITQSSDERLKTNISSLAEENISAKILQLEPLRYEFLSAEELSQRGLPASYADKGEHFGLSAQELEKIFPELVSDVVHILDMEDDNMGETPETVTTKAVNYQELTVLLVAAVQELKTEIEELKTQLNQER